MLIRTAALRGGCSVRSSSCTARTSSFASGLRTAGWRMRYSGDAEVLHHGGATSKRARTAQPDRGVVHGSAVERERGVLYAAVPPVVPMAWPIGASASGCGRNETREATPPRVLLVAAATSTTGGGERHVADLLRRLPAASIELGPRVSGRRTAVRACRGAACPCSRRSTAGSAAALWRSTERPSRGSAPTSCTRTGLARRPTPGSPTPAARARRLHGARHPRRQGRVARRGARAAPGSSASALAHGGPRHRLRSGPRRRASGWHMLVASARPRCTTASSCRCRG